MYIRKTRVMKNGHLPQYVVWRWLCKLANVWCEAQLPYHNCPVRGVLFQVTSNGHLYSGVQKFFSTGNLSCTISPFWAHRIRTCKLVLASITFAGQSGSDSSILDLEDWILPKWCFHLLIHLRTIPDVWPIELSVHWNGELIEVWGTCAYVERYPGLNWIHLQTLTV